MTKIDRFEKPALIIARVGFSLFVTVLVCFLFFQYQQPNFKNAFLYPKPKQTVDDFTLSGINQASFQKKDLLGKWSFIFFGYTHCPDVCPQTLQTMQLVAKAIDSGVYEVDTQFIFISVDPERDQHDQLRNYVHYFNPRFLGLTGNQMQLQKINEIFDTQFDKVTNSKNPLDYSMAHSASIYITNPNAERFALLPPPLNVNHIINDFTHMQSL